MHYQCPNKIFVENNEQQKNFASKKWCVGGWGTAILWHVKIQLFQNILKCHFQPKKCLHQPLLPLTGGSVSKDFWSRCEFSGNPVCLYHIWVMDTHLTATNGNRRHEKYRRDQSRPVSMTAQGADAKSTPPRVYIYRYYNIDQTEGS